MMSVFVCASVDRLATHTYVKKPLDQDIHGSERSRGRCLLTICTARYLIALTPKAGNPKGPALPKSIALPIVLPQATSGSNRKPVSVSQMGPDGRLASASLPHDVCQGLVETPHTHTYTTTTSPSCFPLSLPLSSPPWHPTVTTVSIGVLFLRRSKPPPSLLRRRLCGLSFGTFNTQGCWPFFCYHRMGAIVAVVCQ